MASPITTARNNYHNNEKDSSIYTPPGLCQFLYDLTVDKINWFEKTVVFDSSMGSGNLLRPYVDNYFEVWGIEWDLSIANSVDFCRCIPANFLNLDFSPFSGEIARTGLVIQNPPFNNQGCFKGLAAKEIDYKLCSSCLFSIGCMKYYLKSINRGNALLSELFLDRTWEVFGKEIPCICIVPMGFRLNQRLCSSRFRHVRDDYPDITTIVSLPLDIFPGVEFQCEVIIFNIRGLKAHYYLPEKYLEKGETNG